MPAAIPFLVQAIVSTAIAAVGSVASGLLSLAFKQNSPKIRTRQSRDQKQRQNITSTIASLPVVYGTARVGGLRVFAHSELAYKGYAHVPSNGTVVRVNTKGDYLYTITALCEGEISSIDTVFIDGVDSSDEIYKSPYRVNLKLGWIYTEPESVKINNIDLSNSDMAVYSNLEILSPVNNINNTRLDNISSQTSTTSTENINNYSIPFVQVQRQRKYKLYRKDINTNKEVLILETQVKTNRLELNNTDYGHYIFRLEYIPDSGIPIIIGSTEVILTENNNDFQVITEDNLFINQDSDQEGEYIKSDYRLGGEDNNQKLFFSDELENYDSGRKGNKIAYLAHRLLKHNAGPKSSETAIKRIPEITAIVKGRVILDPRDNNYKFSDNPALCILDYLSNKTYGFGINIQDINLDSIITSANYCDELINNKSRYSCNGVLDTNNKLIDNLKELLTSCNGQVIWSNGKWTLFIEHAENNTVYEFNQENLIGNVEYNTLGVRYKQNTLKVKYIEPEINYQYDVLDIQSEQYKNEDKKNLFLEYELPFTTDYDQAQRLGIIQLKKSRLNHKVKFTASIASYQVQAGDIVKFNYPAFGWVDKQFIIETSNLTAEGEIEFSANEYDVNIYNTSDYKLKPAYTETNLQSPFKILPVSNIQAIPSYESNFTGDYYNIINLLWTKSTSPDITHYQVEYKTHGHGEWQLAGQVQETGIKLNNILPGTYDVRVKAINSLGYESKYTRETIEILEPPSIPPNINNFVLTSDSQGHGLFTWEAIPELKNNGYYRIKYISNNNNWSDIAGFEYITTDNKALLPVLEGYYLIKAVALLGLESESPAQIQIHKNTDNIYKYTLSHQAHNNNFTGDKINCYINPDNHLVLAPNKLFDNVINNWDDWLENWDLIGIDDTGIIQYPNTAVYSHSEIINLQDNYSLKLTRELIAHAYNQDLDWDSITNNIDNNINYWDGSSPDDVQVNTLYSVSQDNINWSDWRLLTSNEEYCQYIKFRTEILKQDTEIQVEIEELSVNISLKKQTQSNKENIPVTGKTIVFPENYYNIPNLVVSIDNIQSGDYYEINNLTNTGFNIITRDSSNTAVNRYINWISDGV